jgi:hypothetical protein
VQEASEAVTESITGEDNEDTSDDDELSYFMPSFEGIEADLIQANKELEDYVSLLTLEYEESPDNYYLTAESSYLDPSDPLLNRTLAEVEADIKMQDLPDSPEVKRIASIRDALIDYTKSLNSSNELLMNEIEDYNEFTKILVENDDSITERLASLSFDYEEDSYDDPNLKEEEFSLIAFESSDAMENFEDMTSGESTSPVPLGVFVGVGNQTENILNYTEELSGNVNLLFKDVDNDDDHDLIFSLGKDIYLKQNYKSNNVPASYLKKGTIILSQNSSSILDFVPKGGASVQGVWSPYENYNNADLSWVYQPDALYYEVLIRRSLLNSEEDYFKKEVLDVNDLKDPLAPSISLELENGNYYASVYAINSRGEKSLTSNTTIIAPQICADKEAPFPAISKESFDLSIFKELEIDASASFDATGNIIGYYLETIAYSPENGSDDFTELSNELWSDLNSSLDDDGDGIVWNDRNNPQFKIGSFEKSGDVGVREFILHVVDQTGNSSDQSFEVNVFSPEISLNDTISRTFIASGEVLPKVSDLPFSIFRSRFIYRVVNDSLHAFPEISKIITPSADSNGKYYTDSDGRYEVSDFNLEDMILVRNSNKEIVAEIDPETGDIGALSGGYYTVVNPAVPPLKPTSVDIFGPNGELMGTVHVIADPNSDVKLHEEVGFDSTNYKSMSGVNASDLSIEDALKFIKFSASDPSYPGGVALVNTDENKYLMILDSSGNIIVLDKRVSIKQKSNIHTDDPLVIDVYFESKKVAEVYVSTYSEVIILGPNDVPFNTPRAPSSTEKPAAKEGLFSDLSPYLNELAEELFAKKIFDGTLTDDGFSMNPEELIKRSEFVKVLLNLLCIIPRQPEAYLAYSQNESDGGFSDVIYDENNLPWYYPYIKEADLRGLIFGYTGETDPDSGLHPFKPDSTITRAEAVNIILQALEMQGVLDLTSLEVAEPWYEPIMQAAQDLTPYLKDDQALKNNFIITQEEASDPNKEMTREDLMIMAFRVLEFYNCFEIDTNKNGLSDFCEEKYGVSDPYADNDDDGLNNLYECYYGYNPIDEDTDLGGLYDGEEISYGTNPFDPTDDFLDDDHDGLSTQAEIIIYGTDPYNPDTDFGGVSDGDEVLYNYTDPLNGDDDFSGVYEFKEGERGLYIVPANCNSCPCVSTFLHKADIISGDIFFTVISTYLEDYIFSKSNEVVIE